LPGDAARAADDHSSGASEEDADDDVLAHEAIANAAENVLADAAEALVGELESHQRGASRLVVTGHSLGGGVALLAALLLDQRLRDAKTHAKRSSRGLIIFGGTPSKKARPANDAVDALVDVLRRKDTEVRAVAFSPPPVVARFDRPAPFLESYYVDEDVVHSLSYRSVLTLLRELDAIDGPLPRRARLAYLAAKPFRSAAGSTASHLGSRTRMPPPRTEKIPENTKAPWLVGTLRPVLDAVRAASLREARDDPAAPVMVVPGAVYRMVLEADDWTAVADEDVVPVVRIVDGAIPDHLPDRVEAAVDALFGASSTAKKNPKAAVACAAPVARAVDAAVVVPRATVVGSAAVVCDTDDDRTIISI